jgi:hypothetical protein
MPVVIPKQFDFSFGTELVAVLLVSIGLNTKTMYIWASVTYIFHIIYQSACVQSIHTSLYPVKRILLHFNLSNVENIQSAKFSIIKLKASK